MAKYRDINGLGKSTVIPKQKFEGAKQRHERRYQENYKHRFEVNQFCQEHGIGFYVRNKRHHWIFTNGGKIAEWWPATAKCVFDHHYKRGIHVHDYKQMMHLLTKRWNLQKKPPMFPEIPK